MKKRQTLLYIIIAAVACIAVVLMVYILPGLSQPDIPIVLPTDTPDPDGENGENGKDPTQQDITVTTENVQIVLQTISRAENYSRTLSIESFWSGGSSSQTIEVAARGDSCKMSISQPESETTKYILISGSEKWIWQSDSDNIYHGPAGENDEDRYQTLLSYEDILALDTDGIIEAYSGLYQEAMCICVRYTSGRLGYESLAYIDISSGLLLGLETYDGQELIYRMSSTLPDLSTPDESFFEHPEQES